MTGNIKLLFQMLIKDLSSRFYGSILGIFSVILIPAITFLIYAIVFGALIGQKIPSSGEKIAGDFVLYLGAGLVPWFALLEGILRMTYLPESFAFLARQRSVSFSFLSVYAAFFTLIHGVIYYLSFMVIFLAFFDSYILFQRFLMGLPYLFILFLFSFCVSPIVILASVFIRDFRIYLPVFLQLLFWVTPICYSSSLIDENLQDWPQISYLLSINPIRGIVEIFQSVLFHEETVENINFVWLLISHLAFGFLSAVYCNRFSHKMWDEIL